MGQRWDAASYDRFRPAPPMSTVRLALSTTKHSGRLQVLDIGCGTGLFTRQWAAAGARVVGIDPSPAMLEVAAQGRATDIAWLQAKAESLPIREASVDFVSFASSIHWADPVPTAAEVARVVKPGGCVVVVGPGVPYPADWPQAQQLWVRAREQLEASDVGGPRRWRWKDHEQCLVATGAFSAMEVEQVETSYTWTLDDVMSYLSTLGAVREGSPIVTAMLRDARQRLGDGPTSWVHQWYVGLLRRSGD